MSSSTLPAQCRNRAQGNPPFLPCSHFASGFRPNAAGRTPHTFRLSYARAMSRARAASSIGSPILLSQSTYRLSTTSHA